MRLVRYQLGREVYYGSPIGNDKVMRIEGDVFGEYKMTDCEDDLTAARLLPPSVPTKIVAVGKNYAGHAKEMGGDLPENPILFIKPSTSVLPPFGEIVYPAGVNRLDYEGELAFVVKKTASKVSRERAAEYILGYTCLNDVTARDIQKKDGQWTRAKSFDTFAPFGPYLTDEIDPDCVRVRTLLNGRVVQEGNTGSLAWKCAELLEFITACMTLLPGDVVTTGTPEGIGPMSRGDTVEVVIDGIGTLRNTVV